MDRTDGAVGLVVPWESGPAASRRQGSGHGVGPPPTPDDGSVRGDRWLVSNRDAVSPQESSHGCK